jgi:hypothetical protein
MFLDQRLTPIAGPWGEGRKNGRETGPQALEWPRDSPGLRKTNPLNNNRGNNNNNRRRGRGNNNGGGRPQGGGNQQVNRIDSRARGNAPQLLEKYRKLAHDAHLNGDRVTAEYYLQFADHYFRVIADTRLRQEEARARRDDRWQDSGEAVREESDDSAEFSVESDFPAFDQPPVYTRREREDRPEGGRSDSNGRNEPRRRDEHIRRDDQPRREETPRREAEPTPTPTPVVEADGNVAAPGEPLMYEPPENPFLRESRVGRSTRPRREPREDRRPAKAERREAALAPAPEAPAEGAVALDPALLPPSISSGRKGEEPEVPVAEEAPAPKRRTRRKVADKPAADAAASKAGDGHESLEQVG